MTIDSEDTRTIGSSNVTVAFLIDNNCCRENCVAEHGLSILLDFRGHRILFDTGQTALAHNAHALAIDLRSTDAIVISHGHYDHTGGLAWAMRVAAEAKLYAHPACIPAKYSAADAGIRRIGMPRSARKAFFNGVKAGRTVDTKEPFEILPGLYATGSIPRSNRIEDVGGAFYLDTRCSEPDALIDDQALFFETSNGLVVLLGCAHSGVINTLDYISKLAAGKDIRAVLGGMHLRSAGKLRIEATIDKLRECGVSLIAPSHCTGSAACSRLEEAFGDGCLVPGAGTFITL